MKKSILCVVFNFQLAGKENVNVILKFTTN